MLLLALLALPALPFLSGAFNNRWLLIFAVPLIASMLGPTLLYTATQRYLHPESWIKRLLILPGLIAIGFGICISNTQAVLEAILGIESPFVRTPKSGESKKKAYRTKLSLVPFLELTAAVYCTITLCLYVKNGNFGIAPFLGIYVIGFTLVGFSSLREQLQK